MPTAPRRGAARHRHIRGIGFLLGVPRIHLAERFGAETHELPERLGLENALGIEDLVRSRLARQTIFDKPDAPQLLVVMSESSLRRMQGGPEVMRAQIDYLITLSRRPNIQLQVLPFNTRTYHGASVSYRFTILRIPSPGVAGSLELVYIDQVVDFRYLEDKPDLAAHDKNCGIACPPRR